MNRRTPFSFISLSFFAFIVVYLFQASALAQKLDEDILDSGFKQRVNQTLDNIRAIAGKPLSPFKSPREANDKIIKAMELIQIDKNYPKGRELLKDAIAINKDNFFAYLLLGVTLDLENKQSQSTPYYLGFLKYSLGTSIYEHGIPIENEDILYLRTSVRKLLLKRNVNISEGISSLKLNIRRKFFLSFILEKDQAKLIYDILFIFFIVFGISYYYYRKVAGASYFAGWEEILFKLTGCSLVIYILEIIQTLFEWPRLFSTLTQRTILLIVFAGGYILTSTINNKIQVKRLLKDPKNRQCSNCKKVIQKINIECPYCKKRK